MKRVKLKAVRTDEKDEVINEETLILCKNGLRNYILENVEDVSYYNDETFFNEICRWGYSSDVEEKLREEDLLGIMTYSGYVSTNYSKLRLQYEMEYDGEGIYDIFREECFIPLHDDWLKDEEYCFAYTIKDNGWLETPTLGNLYVSIKWEEQEELVTL